MGYTKSVPFFLELRPIADNLLSIFNYEGSWLDWLKKEGKSPVLMSCNQYIIPGLSMAHVDIASSTCWKPVRGEMEDMMSTVNNCNDS